MKTQPKFCPICGSDLQLDQKLKISVCSKCGYQFWRNAKPTVSAIIVDGDKILLFKRSTKKFFGYWDGPGGFLDNGEDPREGLKREVREEIGVEVDVIDLLNMVKEEDYENPLEDSNILAMQFLCRIKSGTPQPLDEASEVRWFEQKEIPWGKIAFPGIKNALEIIFKMDDPYLPS